MAAVSRIVRGIQLSMHPGYRDEMLTRAALETREELWTIVCVKGDANYDDVAVQRTAGQQSASFIHAAYLPGQLVIQSIKYTAI